MEAEFVQLPASKNLNSLFPMAASFPSFLLYDCFLVSYLSHLHRIDPAAQFPKWKSVQLIEAPLDAAKPLPGRITTCQGKLYLSAAS